MDCNQWRRYIRACQVKCEGPKVKPLCDLPYDRTDLEMTCLSQRSGAATDCNRLNLYEFHF